MHFKTIFSNSLKIILGDNAKLKNFQNYSEKLKTAKAITRGDYHLINPICHG